MAELCPELHALSSVWRDLKNPSGRPTQHSCQVPPQLPNTMDLIGWWSQGQQQRCSTVRERVSPGADTAAGTSCWRCGAAARGCSPQRPWCCPAAAGTAGAAAWAEGWGTPVRAPGRSKPAGRGGCRGYGAIAEHEKK